MTWLDWLGVARDAAIFLLSVVLAFVLIKDEVRARRWKSKR